MLTVNYILIFAWIFLFNLGEVSALVIFPITMGVAFFDTVMAEGRMSAYLWCGNLLIATVVGIFLQTYLYIRETSDTETAIIRAAIEVPIAVLIIGIVAVISGHEASKLRKRRKAGAGAVVVTDDEDDDDEKDFNPRGGFRSSMILHDDTEDEEDIDLTEEDEDPEEFENEPKFRVIKKS